MPSSYHSGGRSSIRYSSSRGRQARPTARRGRPGKQYIHPSKFVQAAKLATVEEYVHVNNFDDFQIHPTIKQNVINKGFISPTKIQDIAIPHGLDGKDVVGIANTGTGKTTAFALPILHRLMLDPKSRALIMAPTRELATQIEAEARSFAKNSGLFGTLLIGGAPMYKQVRDLRSNPNIVIGTPGRIKDHVQQGNLRLSEFNMVVLDEVDRMVDMGFIADITFLLGQLPTQRQSFFFSATLDDKIERLIQGFLTEPVMVSVKTGVTSDNVQQDVINYRGTSEKMAMLQDVLSNEKVEKVLIFDETQRSVERLSNDLQSKGFKVDALHGGKTQGARNRAMSRFRRNEVTVLVATDVAARGIDVADITHVINYTTPNTYEDYVHRIGRAGRAGRQGHALTFIDS